jgi:hypothetical protein
MVNEDECVRGSYALAVRAVAGGLTRLDREMRLRGNYLYDERGYIGRLSMRICTNNGRIYAFFPFSRESDYRQSVHAADSDAIRKAIEVIDSFGCQAKQINLEKLFA